MKKINIILITFCILTVMGCDGMKCVPKFNPKKGYYGIGCNTRW